tara:strand:+ start:18222 stop:18923 length:702 start_codon:yes stop_codon:yes gene_type:complete
MYKFSNKFDVEYLFKTSANVSFLNHHSYLISRNHKKTFKKIDHIYADGLFFHFFVNLLVMPTKKISFDMSSIAANVFLYSEKTSKRVFLVGGQKGVASEFESIINKQYPDLCIIGSSAGFFADENEKKETLRRIIDLKADIVIAGMGTPFQEYFLIDLKEMGWHGLGFTCGGFFHQTVKSGINFYPKVIKQLKLRWLYRIFKEPYTVPRYTIAPIKFLFFFVYDCLFKSIKKT